MLPSLYNHLSNDRFFDLFTPLTVTTSKMPIDILELDGSFEIKTDLPGVTKEEINLEFKEKYLIISVLHNREDTDTNNNYLVKERTVTNLSRRIYFNKEIDPDTITATLKDGVLIVTVNKLETKTNKKILIN